MKRSVLIILLISLALSGRSQIKFDISKYKHVSVDKLVKEKSENIVYFEVKYGGAEFITNPDIKKYENRVVKKIQYVYTDYPKDFDYTELEFQRFASLYVVMPSVFNKPWIEWEIVKQTKCGNAYEAGTMFHGFVITYKEGPEPNKLVPIPPEILQKMAKLNSSVEFTNIKSFEDLNAFMAVKETKIWNVTYPYKDKAIKIYKQHDNGSLSIVKGLFLCTGLPSNAIGPNTSPSSSSVISVAPTAEKSLSALVGGSPFIFDAAVIEFDMQIDADSLVFKYAFASEEYPEYLEFNDVFGLFITGPGLNGNLKDTTLNLATLPDHKTPISVSSINHLSNKEYYIANDYNVDLKLFKTWQYDGFTKVLTAKVAVKRKQKYHLKFAIADFGDPYYDSAIFIDAFGIRSK